MKKSLIVSYFLFALTSLMSIELRADVSPATTVSGASWVSGSAENTGLFRSFGMHCFFGDCPGGLGNLYVATGTGINSTPYIYAHGASLFGSDGILPLYQPTGVGGSVNYNWTITQIDGGASSELVPVHIHTHGHYSSSVFTSITDADREGYLEANGRPLIHAPDSRINSSLSVQLVGNGYNECYGVGSLGGGCTEGRDTSYESWQRDDDSNGTVDATFFASTGSFSKDFDFLVQPGLLNYVSMGVNTWYQAGGPYHIYNLGNVTMDLFVDPIITIDPAYADRYAVEVSYIPYVPMPVPEPESYLLLLAGLGVIAAVCRRYKAAA